jgi:type II secretion system protein I
MRLFQTIRRLSIFTDQESGMTLVETLVALAILGAVAVSFLNGMTAASESTFIADEQTTAENLARNQMEEVRTADYVYGATEYPPAPMPNGKDYINYSAVITAEPLNNPDDGIQKITVSIKHFDKTTFRLESYKGQR